MTSCAACSEALPEGARFCPACGTEVVPDREEERRVVTVLFADLVGYTSLSEQLDPEQLKRFLDAAFERLIADIVEFGGVVDKVLGDGILALFGAPIAHEDDAARAIRAATQMQSTLAQFTNEWAGFEEPFRLRVGVNTGEVVVGRVVGTDTYTALGDVVNVASRLQTMAPPGGVYIGNATALLAADDLSLEIVDEVRVRGREQPERVWRVSEIVRPTPVDARTQTVPFVGRGAQRELLSSVMSLVVSGQSAIVAVSGAPGAGKTRLIDEALAQFPSDDVVVLAGKCAPYGETNPWAPLAQALVSRFGLEGDMVEAELRSRAVQRAIGLFGDADPHVVERFADAILKVFGYPSALDREPPGRARETIFQVMTESVLNRSAVKPVVIWIDDLQWADGAVVEYLKRISEAAVSRPVLILTAMRDDNEVEWPPVDPSPFTVRLPLEPLTRAEADELTALLLGDDAAMRPGALFERSGGNPLFHIQLAALARSNPDSTDLPGTLRALIAAQLDRLEPGPRAVIDNASVIGTSGPVAALSAFAASMAQEYDESMLNSLVDDGLLAVNDDLWRFRSDVVREVAYLTLTKAHRAERHAGVAMAMRTAPGIPIDRLAHQAAAAAELVLELGSLATVPESVTADAEHLLFAAARNAIDTGALTHSMRHATRGIELIDRRRPVTGEAAAARDDLRRELLLLRAEAYVELHEMGAAHADATVALEASRMAGDQAHEGRALRLLGESAQRLGDVGNAQGYLARSVELFRELGDEIELAASLREFGLREMFSGDMGNAEKLLAESEAISERQGDRRGLAWARQHLAWASFLAGDTQKAADRLIGVADEFRDLGDRSGVGWATGLLAYVRFQERDFDAAEQLATETREGAAALGEWWAPAMMDSLVASIRLWLGDFERAEDLSRRALHVFRSHEDRFGMLMASAPNARALIALGRTIDAERSLEELSSLGEAAGGFGTGPMAAAGTAVHLGAGARAVELAERSVVRLESMGANPTEAYVTSALALCQVGRAEDALAVLLKASGDGPYLWSTRALASALVGDHDAAAQDARRAIDDEAATYLDRTLAYVALATSHVQTGDEAAAAEVFESAYRFAIDTGGAVAVALVVAARSNLAGAGGTHPSISLRPGWQCVIDGLVAAA